MSQQLANGKQQFIDGNGNPLAGGSVAFYLPGTLTPTNTWQDPALTTPNANPVVLDALGMASIWGADGTQYRQVVQDALGNTIWDEVVGDISGGSSTQVFIVGPAAPGTAQAPQAQQLAGDALPIHATSGPGATPFALRNRIINGSFRINQRSYVSATALGAGAYAHDRWKAGAAGCTYIFAQAANGQQITITAGALQQIIEAASIEGGEYTLSWTGTAQGSVNGGAAAASPITVSGLAASANVTVQFGTGTVGEVQFEPGPTATPFEQRPIGFDLAQCQRYYQTTAFYFSQASAGNGVVITSTLGLPVAMRASPTITENFVSGGNISSAVFAAEGVAAVNLNMTANVASGGIAYRSSSLTLSAEL